MLCKSNNTPLGMIDCWLDLLLRIICKGFGWHCGKSALNLGRNGSWLSQESYGNQQSLKTMQSTLYGCYASQTILYIRDDWLGTYFLLGGGVDTTVENLPQRIFAEIALSRPTMMWQEKHETHAINNQLCMNAMQVTQHFIGDDWLLVGASQTRFHLRIWMYVGWIWGCSAASLSSSLDEIREHVDLVDFSIGIIFAVVVVQESWEMDIIYATERIRKGPCETWFHEQLEVCNINQLIRMMYEYDAYSSWKYSHYGVRCLLLRDFYLLPTTGMNGWYSSQVCCFINNYPVLTTTYKKH